MSAHLKRQGDHYDALARKFGFATFKELQERPLRYHWHLIERDINRLLSRRRDLPARRGKTIPDALVNYLAVTYLGCCSTENRPPPQELVHLIAQQMETARFGVKAAKAPALIRAQELRNSDPQISNIAIAKSIKVNKATVGRWVKDGLLVAAS
jgi:hypothetical protein